MYACVYIYICIDLYWLRTNGVSTNGAGFCQTSSMQNVALARFGPAGPGP